MKLILAVIQDVDDGAVIRQLTSHGYRVTRMASTGGFLRRGNVTLMIGVEDDKTQSVIDLLHESCCTPEEPEKKHVTLFVVNALHFEQV